MPQEYYSVECSGYQCYHTIYATEEDFRFYCGSCYSDNIAAAAENGNAYHVDDLYYWESDESYHLEEYPEELRHIACDYCREDGDPAFLVGVELECYPASLSPYEYKQDLERRLALTVSGDGSLAQGGVEIQTPPLTLEGQLELIQSIYVFHPLNIDEYCGLHVNVSLSGFTLEDNKTVGRRMLHALRDMGQEERERRFGREANHYCALNPDQMTQKYSAVRAGCDRIEIRLPAPHTTAQETSRRIAEASVLFLQYALEYIQEVDCLMGSVFPEELKSDVQAALNQAHAYLNPESQQLELSSCV